MFPSYCTVCILTTNMTYMKVFVDLMKYCEVYEGGYKERSMDGDIFHDWCEMDVTPEKLKELIDNAIDIKMIDNEES